MYQAIRIVENCLDRRITDKYLLQNSWLVKFFSFCYHILTHFIIFCINNTGCITNSMIDDLVTKVITVEDIPVDVASELITLFNMVLKRTPQIFPVSIYNNIYVEV